MPARQCGKPFVEVVINDLLGLGTHLRKHKATGNWGNLLDKRASQAAVLIKNPHAVWETEETWVRSLGREDPLEEGMATHSSILAWRIPWTEEPCGLQSMRSQRVRHN